MHSYTSNTDNNEKKHSFIMRLVISFVIVCGLYYLLTCIVPKSDDGPGLYFTNVLKAQRFTLSTENAKVILVGSSMASVVNIEDYSEEYVILAAGSKAGAVGVENINEEVRREEERRAEEGNRNQKKQASIRN